MTTAGPPPSRPKLLALPALGFVAFTALVVFGVTLYVARDRAQFVTQAGDDLMAIANLKVESLTNWRDDRAADAAAVSDDPLARRALGLMQTQPGTEAPREVGEWLSRLATHGGYYAVMLAAPDGAVLQVSSPGAGAMCPGGRLLVARAWRESRAALGDLEDDAPGEPVHVDLAAPVLSPEGKVLAVALMRRDPSRYLNPFIRSWPIPSASAETLLVRREGEELVFLNDLRHRKDAALKLRLPVANERLPAAMAVRGFVGVVQGLDYRGVEVVAAVRAVPNSPWFLVAKVDADEVFAPLAERRNLMALAALCLVLAAGSGLGWTARSQRIHFLLREREAEALRLTEAERARDALQKSEASLAMTLASIGDAVIATDAQGRIERMNSVAEALTGWPAGEAKGRPLTEVFRVVNEATHAALESPVDVVLRERRTVELASDTVLVPRQGPERPIKDTGAPIRDAKGEVTGVVLVFRDGTEERARHEALVNRASLVESLRDAVVSTGSDFVVRTWNAAAEQTYGYTAAEAKDQPLRALLHMQNVEPGEAQVGRILDQGGPLYCRLNCQHRDGHRVDIECTVVGLTDARGERTGWVGVHRDITERLRGEAVRDALAKLYQPLLAATATAEDVAKVVLEQAMRLTQSTSGMVAAVDPSTKEFVVEATGKPLTPGAPRQRFSLGAGAERYVHVNAAVGERRAIIDNEFCKQVDTQLLPAGHAPLERAMVVPAVIAGEAVGIIMLTDSPRPFGPGDQAAVTALADMYALNLRRRHSEAALRESETRFRLLTQSSLIGIVQLDSRGQCLFANDSWRAITGQTEATGASWLGKVDPDDKARVTGEWETATSQGRTFETEYRVRRLGEKVTWVLGSAVALKGADGMVTGYLGTLTDITERKKMQTRLVLADRMVSLGTLAAGVAHEINNPLAYVLSNITYAADELRAEGGALSPARLAETVAALGEALDGAQRVRRIVRDLKIFSRPEDDELARVDVEQVLESSINMANNEIRHRAQLVRDFGGVPPVEAHDSRLGQVFLNLLVNAAQAIPEGHASRNEIRVTTRLDAGGRVRIEVQDTGSGIPADILGRIFDPFFTTKPVGVGTGLGLSICHGLVTGLGGEIVVESTVGRGTTFKVYLPVAESLPEAEEGAAPQVAVRRGKVLVVDDEPMVGKALQRMLGHEHNLTVLTGAPDALERLQRGERFDVILCDLMMPEVSGMELHDEVARFDPAQASRMVFVTGGAFSPEAREFLERVPNLRLDKPFDLGALRRALLEHLGSAG